MDDPVYLYIVGTAGSGKSHFTAAMQRWMTNQGLSAVTVNLDPGAESLPYAPDVDIRDWVRLADVMDEYDLGPNGAQVMAADLIALRLGDIMAVLEGYTGDYVLVDTPGQSELFVFREAGKVTVEMLAPGRSAIAFMVDPFLAKKPNAFVSLQMLGATTLFRFGVPMLNVLTKSDLLKPEERERVLAWANDPHKLEDALNEERADMYTQMTTEVFRALDGISGHTPTYAVSSEALLGLEDIYAWVQESFGASEDLEKR